MFGGSAGVLSQAATKPKIVSQFKCIAADLVRIATERHWQLSARLLQVTELQACVLVSDVHFEHEMW